MRSNPPRSRTIDREWLFILIAFVSIVSLSHTLAHSIDMPFVDVVFVIFFPLHKFHIKYLNKALGSTNQISNWNGCLKCEFPSKKTPNQRIHYLIDQINRTANLMSIIIDMTVESVMTDKKFAKKGYQNIRRGKNQSNQSLLLICCICVRECVTNINNLLEQISHFT